MDGNVIFDSVSYTHLDVYKRQRFYQETNDKKYLDYALQRMNEYITYGMTEAYMNYNWYQRPEWTEPCAIIDSYLVAMELFRFTEDIAWLELGQKILYNGIGAAQRSNGGFGTDSCVGVSNQTLNLHGFEATQCLSLIHISTIYFSCNSN